MGFFADLIQNMFLFLASLIYALFDLIIAEVIALAIAKKTAFKDTEYFVVFTLGVGVLIFFISNILQNVFIDLLVSLRWWLFLVFISAICLNILILCKFSLGRTWKFRLVVYSSAILAIIVLGVLIYWGFSVAIQEQTINTAQNTTEILG